MRTLVSVPPRAQRAPKGSSSARARIAFIAAVTVGCLVATQGASQAAPPESPALGQSDQSVTDALSAVGIKVRADGWIEYDSVLRRAGVSGKTSRVAGVRGKDGACALSGSAQASSGSSRTTYTEEVAYNPATCEFDVLVGDLTAEQAATLRSLTGAAASDVSSTKGAADASSPRGTTGDNAAAATYSRYLKTSWIDPIDITISSQSVGLRWSNTQWLNWAYQRDSFKGCIGSVCLDETYIVSGSDSLATLSDGWTKNANVHFQNVSFALWVVAILGPTGWAACGFPSSSQADFYHTDSVTGRTSGASSWNWNDSKSGACTNLVHHGDETGASYPF
ncbi:hypothetical protein [Micromonospora tarensis]|uniref:PASTA domain-containing protein n=1 Tax=Micromonospora tarensis TaxID=2806100 RepID=A0ABS1YJM4_9ACTN|nr:hypothetical protein [Micromonospora tarensis]MBM0277625.1 hypothetical protein [Micromonospora tarensis]